MAGDGTFCRLGFPSDGVISPDGNDNVVPPDGNGDVVSPDSNAGVVLPDNDGVHLDSLAWLPTTTIGRRANGSFQFRKI
ncbi:hypothetical protein GUJ93_ZPchr0015g6663 [Zizania palustris]|uniref:Uncharacterized protein n=1 Tax=Zizania palustris TaxID=103762 RepID=A0A8J5SYG8_ZIZPA|nr:hypothetical protein GUJ93_ZPchr0015g6663 [Zizania palustris]